MKTRKRHSMARQTILSRKLFLRLLTGFGTGTFFWIWYRMSDIQADKENLSEFRHGEIIPPGVSHFGKYFLFRKDDSVIAFSTVCTHAGCRIGESKSGILQCGCHGSRFDAATGKPVNGPAIHPLTELDCRFDAKTGEWIVKLKPRTDKHV